MPGGMCILPRRDASEAKASETERQKLGVASGVAIHQGAEADLVGNAGAGEAFGDDADHDAEHGGAAVEEFHPLELIQVDLPGVLIGQEGIVGWGVRHGNQSVVSRTGR
jgi:hypothetical protein